MKEISNKLWFFHSTKKILILFSIFPPTHFCLFFSFFYFLGIVSFFLTSFQYSIIILLDFISVQHSFYFSTAFFFKTNTNNSEWEKLYFEKQIMGLIRYKTNYGLIGNMKSGELSKSCKLIEKLMNKHFTLCSVIDID